MGADPIAPCFLPIFSWIHLPSIPKFFGFLYLRVPILQILVLQVHACLGPLQSLHFLSYIYLPKTQKDLPVFLFSHCSTENLCTQAVKSQTGCPSRPHAYQKPHDILAIKTFA